MRTCALELGRALAHDRLKLWILSDEKSMSMNDMDAQLKRTDTTLDRTFDAMAQAVQTTDIPPAILSLAAQLQAKLDSRRDEPAVEPPLDSAKHL